MYQLALCSLLGGAQGFMLMLVFLRLDQGNRLANLILSAFIGLQTLRLSVYYLLYESAFVDWPWVYLLLNLNIASGPLIFLYTQAQTTPNFQIRWHMLLHFLPALLFLLGSLYWSSIHGLETEQLRNWLWEVQPGADHNEGDEIYALSVFIALIYSLLACRLLWQHADNIRRQFSNIDSIHLGWLWGFVLLFAGGVLIGIVYDFMILVLQINLGPRMTVALIVATLQIYYLAYYGLRQKLIYEVTATQLNRGLAEAGLNINEGVEDKDVVSTSVTNSVVNMEKLMGSPDISGSPESKVQKYQKSSLTHDASDQIWQRLLRLMSESKPFLDSGLNLTHLANLLSVSNDHLTQVISQHGDKNFYDFINDYRVDVAKQSLTTNQNSKHHSLLNIALDCGFSSQSTFSTRFKRSTGQTPSEFRKNIIDCN